MGDNTFFSIQKEMAMIRARQEELVSEASQANMEGLRSQANRNEHARLQIVYDYLRDKYLITVEGNGKLH